MRGVRHALFGTRNSILYLLVQVAEVLGTRFSDGLHSEAENSVSQSVGLLENGLSLKGPFVFLAGRDKHRGPSERASGREGGGDGGRTAQGGAAPVPGLARLLVVTEQRKRESAVGGRGGRSDYGRGASERDREPNGP